MFQDDNEKNIEKVLIKYAKDMSSMCNIIANKAFLETTDIGKHAKNGNVNASKSLSGIINNIAVDSGFMNDKSELRFVHTEINKNTFQSSLEIRRKIKEEGDDEDKVDIDRMIKNAGLKKGGAEA